jgi:hypothetical protein
MATQRQIQANRANARQSTGPRTPQGKQAVAGNHLIHGLYAQFALLDEEDHDLFHNLRGQLHEQLQPVGILEQDLVERIGMAMWQLRRVLAYETGYLNLLARDPHNSTRHRYRPSRDPERLATLFMHDETRDSPRLETLSRHRVRHERSYYKALHELERLQQARAGHPVPPPEVIEIHADVPAADPPAPPPPPVSPSPSASQSAENKRDNPKLALNRKNAAITPDGTAVGEGNRGDRPKLERLKPVGKPVEV